MVYWIILRIVLAALVRLTTHYFPAGVGRSTAAPPVTATPWILQNLTEPDPREPVSSRYTTEKITQRYDAALASANATLAAIAANPQVRRTVDNILFRFEQAMEDIADATLPLSMMSYVYHDPAILSEGSACNEKTGSSWSMFTPAAISTKPCTQSRPAGPIWVPANVLDGFKQTDRGTYIITTNTLNI